MEQTHDGYESVAAHGDGGISRRTLIGGIGGLGAAGAIGLAAGLGGPAHALATPLVQAGDVADAIEAPVDGLVYLPLDALAFDVGSTDPGAHRIYQQTTGVQPATTTPMVTTPRYVYAALPIPIGSVIRKLNVSYFGQPIISIAQRTLGQNTFPQLFGPFTTAATGANPRSQTFSLDLTLTAGATYVLEVFCLAGESILGVEIGYIPPALAFVPYTGNAPRVFDSRDSTKFAANEERVIDLSSRLIATARAAVINLTATQTDGPGFLAAFTDGPYPNNSTLNFTGADATVANGAVVTMTAGRIKVRTGPAGSHVIVDVIGSLL